MIAILLGDKLEYVSVEYEKGNGLLQSYNTLKDSPDNVLQPMSQFTSGSHTFPPQVMNSYDNAMLLLLLQPGETIRCVEVCCSEWHQRLLLLENKRYVLHPSIHATGMFVFVSVWMDAEGVLPPDWLRNQSRWARLRRGKELPLEPKFTEQVSEDDSAAECSSTWPGLWLLPPTKIPEILLSSCKFQALGWKTDVKNNSFKD